MTLPPVVFPRGFAISSERTWRDTGWVDILTDEERNLTILSVVDHFQPS